MILFTTELITGHSLGSSMVISLYPYNHTKLNLLSWSFPKINSKFKLSEFCIHKIVSPGLHKFNFCFSKNVLAARSQFPNIFSLKIWLIVLSGSELQATLQPTTGVYCTVFILKIKYLRNLNRLLGWVLIADTIEKVN